MKHIIILGNEVFKDGDDFFTLKSAKEFVKWAEEKFPDNKGKYMVMELTRVRIEE